MVKRKKSDVAKWIENRKILLMEDILHHLGCINPCKSWEIYHINRWTPDFVHQQYETKRKIRQSCQRSRLQHLGARPERGLFEFHGLELPVVDSMAWPCSQPSPSFKSMGFRGFFTQNQKNRGASQSCCGEDASTPPRWSYFLWCILCFKAIGLLILLQLRVFLRDGTDKKEIQKTTNPECQRGFFEWTKIQVGTPCLKDHPI